MRYQDQVVKLTQKALEDVCRAALAVPPDKHIWSPGGAARSVLSQMQEIATSATYFIPLIESGVVPIFDDETRKEHRSVRHIFDSVAACIQEARQATAQLCQVIMSFPDRDLEKEVTLPFGAGAVTMADALTLHYWNLVYHLGQINQLQLMLGDSEMH